MSIKKPKWLNWLPYDKWSHVIIGFPFGMLSFVGAHLMLENISLSLLIALFIGSLIGFVKEIGDKINPEKNLFDVLDIVASAVGSFLGGLFCLIVWSLLG